MPRPRICRRIFSKPHTTYFKPAGVRVRDLNEVILTFEEHEALKLIDLESIEQNKAANMMNISQPTLSRILKSARKKVSEAIVKGKAIKIEGGDYQFK